VRKSSIMKSLLSMIGASVAEWAAEGVHRFDRLSRIKINPYHTVVDRVDDDKVYICDLLVHSLEEKQVLDADVVEFRFFFRYQSNLLCCNCLCLKVVSGYQYCDDLP